MPMSDFVARLRELVGNRLLLLPGVAGIIRDEQGRVLFVRSSPEARWGLPAGGAEPGETPAEAVVREVYEETGLDVVPQRLVGLFGGPGFRHDYPNGHEVEWTAMVFECRLVGGTLHAVDGEIAEFAWFDVADAPRLGLGYPPDLLEPRPDTRFQGLEECVVVQAHEAAVRGLKLRRGDVVTVQQVDGTWALVRREGESGWIPARHLGGEADTVDVVESYDATGLSTTVGQRLTVLRREPSTGDCWCLNADGACGWVPGGTLSGPRTVA